MLHVGNKRTCFIFILLNLARPLLKPIDCFEKVLSLVVCQTHVKKLHIKTYQDIQFTFSTKKSHFVFKCLNGTYTSAAYKCDGILDCSDGKGELNCVGLLDVFESSHSSRCQSKYCISFLTILTNSKSHSEEGESQIFSCDNQTFDISLFNDLISDCQNELDEPLLLKMHQSNDLTYKCAKENMIECYPGHSKCFLPDKKCQFFVNRRTQVLLICRNGKHLENCETFNCSVVSKYKCPNSYCIPSSYQCDGKWDCWNGDDEMHCESRTCKGLFVCRSSVICIHIDTICDHTIDCPYGDDEVACKSKPCLKDCICKSLAVNCNNIRNHMQYISNYFNNYLIVSITKTMLFSISIQFKFTKIIILILSNNRLSHLYKPFTYCSCQNLTIFNMTHNDIVIINSDAYVQSQFRSRS